MSVFRTASSRAAAVLLSALAAAALLAGCGSSSSGSSQGATLRVGFISPLPTPTGTAGWAQHRKLLVPGLRSAGIGTVRFVPFKNGPDLSAAVSGGSVDLAVLGDTPALTAKANGLNTRVINQESIDQDTWLFTPKGGATSLAQLRGKTVATQVGSYMYRYFVALLDQQGLSASVRITHIYTTAAVAALRSGGVAAYAAPAGQLTAAMQHAGYHLLDKASADHRDLLGTSVTVVTGQALKAHPELPAAWNAVRAKAVRDMAAHADAYYAYQAKATGTTAAVVRQAQPIANYPSAPFTAPGLKLLAGTNSFLAAKHLEKAAVDLAAWRLAPAQP